ncbi:MAG: DUF1826 domain-containing protein [Pseudomonadota bacterium]
MNAATSLDIAPFELRGEEYRRSAQGTTPRVLADFYQEDVNIAVWQRTLSPSFRRTISEFLTINPIVRFSEVVTPEGAPMVLKESLGQHSPPELIEDIAELVDMFCCLFELKRVGLRLAVLDSAMCPRFHVDRVPGRLVTTYQGVATEWLPHEKVRRDKLGSGSNGKADNRSGLFQSETDIQQLGCGDVAILKGELWEENENAGLVHRSPTPVVGENRLLLTLDFSD